MDVKKARASSRYLLSGRYWLDDPSLISRAQKFLATTGVVTLPGFLSPAALRNAIDESKSKAGDAFVSTNAHNVYLLPNDDDSYEPNHVRNRKYETKVASVACDELSPEGALHELYFGPVGDSLIHFVSSVIGKQLYRLDDKLGAISINVFKEGYQHAYHFDESEYTITISLQKAERGGEFLFSLPFRKSSDDLAVDRVEKILKTGEGVQELDFQPGTLAIFNGQRSLHCVNQVEGECDRLVAVLCFSTRPDVRNSKEVQQQFWGRSKL